MPSYEQHRQRLERRRRELLDRERRVQHDLQRTDGPLSADFADQAVQVENDEALQEIARTAEEEIAAIDTALQRIASGEYGLCKRCGQPIDARRLSVVPQSSTCAKCTT